MLAAIDGRFKIFVQCFSDNNILRGLVATEKLSHGEPTFFVKKVFAMCSINHHNDGHIAVTVPAAIGVQEMLIERSPEKFYRAAPRRYRSRY